jgi:hypothetical protein
MKCNWCCQEFKFNDCIASLNNKLYHDTDDMNKNCLYQYLTSINDVHYITFEESKLNRKRYIERLKVELKRLEEESL